MHMIGIIKLASCRRKVAVKHIANCAIYADVLQFTWTSSCNRIRLAARLQDKHGREPLCGIAKLLA